MLKVSRKNRNLSFLSLAGATLVLGLSSFGCSDSDSKDDSEEVAGQGVYLLGEPNQTLTPVSATGHDRFYAVAFDSQGNYYAAGSVAENTDKTTDQKTLVAKYKPNGDLDPTWGSGGYAVLNLAVGADGEVARGIVVDSADKVLVGGVLESAGAADSRDRDVFVARLSANGSLDQTYGKSGISLLNFSQGEVNGTAFVADGFGGLAIDKTGRVVVEGSQKRDGGMDTDFVVARLDANGALDATFGNGGKTTTDFRNLSASPKQPVLLADGSVIGTGYHRDGTVVLPVLYKLNANGQPDTSYGVNGLFSEAVLAGTTEVYSAVLQGDSVVTVGYGRNNEQENLDFLSLRVNPNGTLDKSYGSEGFVRADGDGFNDNGRNMTVLPDGRFLLIGGGRPASTNVDGMAVVLTADGVADETFGEKGVQLFDFGGANDFLWGAAVSPAGDKVVAVGIKGVGSDPGNDDGALVVIPLNP